MELDLVPAGVRRTLGLTADAAGAFADQYDDHVRDVQSAVGASGSAIVAQALSGFTAHHRQVSASYIQQETVAVVNDAVTATLIYTGVDQGSAEQILDILIPDVNFDDVPKLPD